MIIDGFLILVYAMAFYYYKHLIDLHFKNKLKLKARPNALKEKLVISKNDEPIAPLVNSNECAFMKRRKRFPRKINPKTGKFMPNRK